MGNESRVATVPETDVGVGMYYDHIRLAEYRNTLAWQIGRPLPNTVAWDATQDYVAKIAQLSETRENWGVAMREVISGLDPFVIPYIPELVYLGSMREVGKTVVEMLEITELAMVDGLDMEEANDLLTNALSDVTYPLNWTYKPKCMLGFGQYFQDDAYEYVDTTNQRQESVFTNLNPNQTSNYLSGGFVDGVVEFKMSEDIGVNVMEALLISQGMRFSHIGNFKIGDSIIWQDVYTLAEAMKIYNHFSGEELSDVRQLFCIKHDSEAPNHVRKTLQFVEVWRSQVRLRKQAELVEDAIDYHLSEFLKTKD